MGEPRLGGRPPAVTARLRIAHRAGNDLATLRAVEGIDVDLVEADVHLFRGRLEVRHLKTAGPFPLLWDRWRLANPFAPRLVLEELLVHADPETELMLDLKGRDARLGGMVLGAVRARDVRRPVTICSRNWRLLDPLGDAADARLVYSVGSRRQLRALLRRFGPADGLEGVSVRARLLDASVVRQLRARTGIVMAWGVTGWARAEALRALGVNGIISADREILRPFAQ